MQSPLQNASATPLWPALAEAEVISLPVSRRRGLWLLKFLAVEREKTVLRPCNSHTM